jgi:hypothetical protein
MIILMQQIFAYRKKAARLVEVECVQRQNRSRQAITSSVMHASEHRLYLLPENCIAPRLYLSIQPLGTRTTVLAPCIATQWLTFCLGITLHIDHFIHVWINIYIAKGQT